MIVTDSLPGQAAAEALKLLVQVSQTSMICRASAEELKETIERLLPIFQEVRYSGVELPAPRQLQLGRISDDLRSSLELCQKIISSNRWNLYKNLKYMNKLRKINEAITRFIQGPMQLHMLADLHRLSSAMTERFDRLQGSADSFGDLLLSREG